MPIFEFECSRCNHKFEQLMRLSESRPACPDCGSAQTEKMFSTFGCKTERGFVSAGKSGGCGGCSSHNCSSCN
ncbi:TPA: FmdB family transcriptional regulator [Candidatus Edwardsbacteria bacterium]|nr:FmdB family transcriptional regulator [Candidatus Edwardsbacteria bacterium]HBZ87237.1 FmdB family transcriptional regulator [Candidatus Edwardsbacteria bacterium]